MAVLAGGQTWGLSEAQKEQDKKNVVLVKLTDAALRAINQHNKSKNGPSSSSTSSGGAKPSIRFPSGSSSGVISLPVQGPDGSTHLYEFPFSLSSTDADAQGPQSSFECLATEGDGNGSLQSIGQFQEKIQIKGSDDTFMRFGEKMVESKKESEKRTTQLLEGGRSSKSNTVQRKPQKLTFSRNGKIGVGNSGASLGIGASLGTGSGGANSAIRSHGSSSPSSGIEQSMASTSSVDSGFLTGAHPMLDRGGGGPASLPPPQYSKANAALLKRPLRERIIHLLAVRPAKKPELLSRIGRDGVRNGDRNNVMQVLKSVSTLKDNTYQLHRHIWNDVSEDWPFYTEQDKQQFRRRKPQNLTPPFSDGSTSSSGHSPTSVHHASSSPSSSSSSSMMAHLSAVGGVKRSAPGGGGGGGVSQQDDQAAAKRKRMSSYVRPQELRMEPRKEEPVAASPGRLLGVKSPPVMPIIKKKKSSPKNSRRARNDDGSSNSPMMMMPSASPYAGRQYSPTAVVRASQPLGGGEQSPKQSPGSMPPPSLSSPPNHRSASSSIGAPSSPSVQRQLRPPEEGENSSSSAAASFTSVKSQAEEESPFSEDYKQEFTFVGSAEQRADYRKTFDRLYEDYRILHTQVEKYTNWFYSKQLEVANMDVNSENYSQKVAKIKVEFQNVNKGSWQANKRKLQYLHLKLDYIKNLVGVYDEAKNIRDRQEAAAAAAYGASYQRRPEIRS